MPPPPMMLGNLGAGPPASTGPDGSDIGVVLGSGFGDCASDVLGVVLGSEPY